MDTSTLRQNQLNRRKRSRQQKQNRGYLQGTVIETGEVLTVQTPNGTIKADNLAGGAAMGSLVFVYYPIGAGRPQARPPSGLVP